MLIIDAEKLGEATILEIAQQTRAAALAESEAFLAELPGRHSLIGWNGYLLAKNDYIVKRMDNIINFIGSENRAADLNQYLAFLQGQIIDEQIRDIGEGSNNPGHAVERYGAAYARKELLLSGLLQYSAPRLGPAE